MLPLGIHIKRELVFFFGILIVGVLNSLSVLITYFDTLNGFYVIDRNGNRYLLENMRMPSFVHFVDDSYKGFIVVLICLAGLAIYHYFYHYQESKAIYLMKRLPKKSELHKRCLGVFIVGSLVVLIVVVFVYAIYYGIYLYFTPPECFS